MESRIYGSRVAARRGAGRASGREEKDLEAEGEAPLDDRSGWVWLGAHLWPLFLVYFYGILPNTK